MLLNKVAVRSDLLLLAFLLKKYTLFIFYVSSVAIDSVIMRAKIV